MATDLTSISRFRWLVVCLADEFEDHDLERAKSLVKDRLGARYQSIDEPLKFFDALEEENLIHEGDTNYLKVLLEHLSRNDLIDNVESYERERKVVVRQVCRNPSLLEGPFFGRKVIMDRIVGILDDTFDHIHCIGISGMPGSGKTRLAKEATYRLIHYGQVIFVDLRELPSVEAIFFAIMHALGVECRDYEPEVLYARLQFYDPKKKGGAVIILDNADTPLDSSTDAYQPFVTMVENILNLPNKQIKLVVTSRTGLEHTNISSQRLNCFRLDGENELDIEDAIEIMKYHAGRTSFEEDEAQVLANLCGKIPLALKVIASRFQDGTITPKQMIKHLSSRDDVQAQRLVGSLSHLGLAKVDQLTLSLKDTIKKLPLVHQRNLVRLSVIPGTFDMKAAQEILEYQRKDRVGLKLDLQALKYRSLLESDVDETEGKASSGSPRYNIHLLLRSFLQELCNDSEEPLSKEYKKGEEGFMHHYGKKLQRTTKTFQKDFVKALSSKQDEKANFMYLLECFKTKRFPSQSEAEWLNLGVELMMLPKERLAFYRYCSNRALEDGKLQLYAEFSAFEAQQLLDLGHDLKTIEPCLVKADEVLQGLPAQDSHSVKLSRAIVNQCRGNVITKRAKAADALPLLKESLAIRKDILGDHFLTARTLSSLGQAMQSAAKIERMGYIHEDMLRAIDYYRRAMDMCMRLTGSDKHVDAPTYLLNIGACLHEMSRFGQAIEFFKKSLELERLLGMDGTPGTCITLKNIAMSYFQDEKYNDALPLALRALEGRQTLQGIHPNTARSLYFVGAIYLAMKKYRDARQHFDKALEMEETLWSRGMPHSLDWDHLKDRFERLLVIQGNKQALLRYRKRFKEAEKEINRGEASGWIDRGEDDSSSTTSSITLGQPVKRARSSSATTSTASSSDKVEEPPPQRRNIDEPDNRLSETHEVIDPNDITNDLINDINPDGNLNHDQDGGILIESVSISSGLSEFSGAPPIKIRFGQAEDRTDEGSTSDSNDETSWKAKLRRKMKKKLEKKLEKEDEKRGRGEKGKEDVEADTSKEMEEGEAVAKVTTSQMDDEETAMDTSDKDQLVEKEWDSDEAYDWDKSKCSIC